MSRRTRRRRRRRSGRTSNGDLKQRYLDAGEKETAAGNLATLDANRYANVAKGVGLKPDELLKLHNPKIVAGEAPEEDEEHASVLQQRGNFGPVHEGFYHDAPGAIQQLLTDRNGEAVGALHHPDVGDIDLIYGKEGDPSRNYKDGYGLAKIAAKHPEVLDDLQGFLSGLTVKSRTENRVNLEGEGGNAGVRLDLDGRTKKWLITAFRKDASPAADRRTTDVTARAEPVPAPTSQEASNAESSVAPGETEGKRGVSGGDVLHQASAAEQPRGWFRMLPNGQGYEIGKTKIGDMSTFIHEPAHAFLELFRKAAQMPRRATHSRTTSKQLPTGWERRRRRRTRTASRASSTSNLRAATSCTCARGKHPARA